ncbi:MAG: leucine-rich repeat protein [Nitrosomonadaceae bacterium]|nr:leucine-rich repeat protein [Nitrosomonadaceae bacterium]
MRLLGICTFIISFILSSDFVFAGYDTSSGLDFESLGPSGAMITGSHSANNNTHINIPCTVTDSTTGATYSVSKIHNSSFIDSQNPITSVNIPSCIEEIGLYAFAYNAITSLSIPNGVEIIEGLAFTNNDLASLTIGESVTHIGAQAFYSNNLVSIIIPQSTTFLGFDAFGNNLLTKVIFKGNNPSLGQESVFGGNQNLTVIKNYQNTTGWTDTCSSACFAWDQQLKFVVAPTAYSGPNQTIHDDATPGASVTLNGSNSSDDEGIITYSWSGSDGSSYSGISPIVNVSIGTTLFTLTVTDDDYESNTDPVRVSITLYNNPPVANAGSNQSVPEDATPGASVTLNASGSSDDNLITTYAWSGSDGSSYIGASHTITMPRGTIVYTLTVTDSHGDTDTDTVSITVYNPPPVANAGTNTTIHDDATPGTSVALDASGSSDNNPIASYAWAGSDGSTHTGISPTASVPVGTTVYTLTVTDADGETDTDTVTIILYNDAPTANAGTNQSIRDDSIPGGGSVTLDASGSSDDNPISSYTWTGSDGSSYSGISPAVTVALGTTVYTLTVTDSHGVTDTDTVSITLYNDAPIAEAGNNQTIQDDTTPGVSITLDGSGSTDDIEISSYSWSGSDGSTYSGISPTVSAPVGTTVYTLTVTDSHGETGTDTISINLQYYNYAPIAASGNNQTIHDDVIPGASVTLNANGSSDDIGIGSYSWSGSDGSTYSGISPMVSVAIGTTVFTLTVTDTDGVTDTDTVSITLYNNSPVAHAGTNQSIQDDATPGASVTLDASGSSDDNPVSSYLWSGSDGSSYNGISPTITAPVGTTVYTLLVTDSHGVTAIDTVSITVTPPGGAGGSGDDNANQTPVAEAGNNQTIQDDDIPGTSLTLDGSGSTDDVGISSYSWTGSDGSTYSGTSPTVSLPVGSTIFTLTVTDAGGKTDTDYVYITLNYYNNAPIAEAGNNQTINDDATPGASVTLNANGSSDDIAIGSYSWSGSDGSTYSGLSPTVSVAIGTTVYTLIVTDTDGATDTDTVSITLYNNAPVANAGSNQSILDDATPGDESVTLDASNSSDDNPIVSYAWSGSDGSNFSGVSSTVTMSIGTIVYTLTVADSHGETDTDTVSIALYNNAPVANAGSNQSVTYDGTSASASVTLDGSGSSDENPITSYVWTGDDGSTYTGISPAITTPVGTTVYTLTVTDSHGVTDTDTMTISLATLPPTADAGPNQSFQVLYQGSLPVIELNASGSTDDMGISSYSWSGSNGEIFSGIKPLLSVPFGASTYVLTVRDAENQPDTDSVSITVVAYTEGNPPGESVSKTISTDGTATNSTITYGATSDGETLSTYFSINDEINLFSEIYTDPAYTGQPGEIYVVLVSKENGIIVYTALNEFGIWEVWNTSLKLLPSARYVEALGEVESIVIYSGALDAGEKLIYVGYSLYTPEGVPTIITTLQPYALNVSD